jgi:hypothetical protein
MFTSLHATLPVDEGARNEKGRGSCPGSPRPLKRIRIGGEWQCKKKAVGWCAHGLEITLTQRPTDALRPWIAAWKPLPLGHMARVCLVAQCIMLTPFIELDVSHYITFGEALSIPRTLKFRIDPIPPDLDAYPILEYNLIDLIITEDSRFLTPWFLTRVWELLRE